MNKETNIKQTANLPHYIPQHAQCIDTGHTESPIALFFLSFWSVKSTNGNHLTHFNGISVISIFICFKFNCDGSITKHK